MFDVVTLSRFQFAATIMFHYLFPPLTIGMGVILVYLEAGYLWTREIIYEAAAKFWTQLFAVTFAMGFATGIVMEFESGTNWAVYSRFVGDVFGSALAAEGIFAFFLESGFLAVLDGFDLGVGILHLFARGDDERRMFMAAIGPIWGGNEVWLVTFGGALFAAFPEAYATIFSAFYMAFMLLLTALILRASALDFRSKFASPIWRRAWDYAFFASSTAAALLFGVAVGNGVIGISLNERAVFTESLLDQLKPYPLLVGLLTVAMFAMHGAMYLYLKIPRGELHQRIGQWIWHAWGFFLVLYLLTTIYTLVAVRGAISNFERAPWAAGVVILNVLSVANIPRTVFANKPGQAFLSNIVTIAALVALFGIALWPNLVTARNDPAYSLTVYRAASSEKTLGTMLVIACIGMPLVLTYTTIIYWTFRHRVQAEASGY